MDAALRQFVWDRAGDACEYCHLPQQFDAMPFQIDHILARKHGGATAAENLALSCYDCNVYKGPNIAGIDPETLEVTRLFHPREDDWDDHFAWNGAELTGRTPAGRSTIDVLKINLPQRTEHRRNLIELGLFPA